MAKRKLTTAKKFEIARRSDFSDVLLPVIQNLTANGYNLSDVGTLLGYAGQDPEGWLERLRERYPDLKEAIQVGKEVANAELVRTAFQEAVGYWIEEEEIYANYNKEEHTFLDKSKKTKRRFISPNTQLLFKLLCCRMPEYFSDTRKIQVDKRSIEVKANIEEEIKGFAGALLEAAGVKHIDSKEILPNEVARQP